MAKIVILKCNYGKARAESIVTLEDKVADALLARGDAVEVVDESVDSSTETITTLQTEIDTLKAEIATFGNTDEGKLRKEISNLKGKVTKLESQLKADK